MSPAKTAPSPAAAKTIASRPGGRDRPGGGHLPRPYRSPRLTAYGRLPERTRFGGTQVVDSGGLGDQP